MKQTDRPTVTFPRKGSMTGSAQHAAGGRLTMMATERGEWSVWYSHDAYKGDESFSWKMDSGPGGISGLRDAWRDYLAVSFAWYSLRDTYIKYGSYDLLDDLDRDSLVLV